MLHIYFSPGRSASALLRSRRLQPCYRNFHCGLTNYARTKKVAPDAADDNVSTSLEESGSAGASKKRPKRQRTSKAKLNDLKAAPGTQEGSSRKPPKTLTLAEYLTKAKGRRGPTKAQLKAIDPAEQVPRAQDKTRIDIVNEELCDHVLERLKPSLERHIGCDIVDMNPGPGLFSSKLHDILKPRNHILLEPDSELYLPWLQPLLSADGSTYKLLPESGMYWEHLDEAFSKKYLPDQELLPRGDPRLEKANDTLLFVANIGHYPIRSFEMARNFSKLFLYQMLEAIRCHSTFQGYGLVRVLLWVADSEKNGVLPRVITDRRGISIDAEVSCQDLFEIAGGDGTTSLRKRENALDIESSTKILQKMNQAGIDTPNGRKTKLEMDAITALAGELSEEADALAIKRDFHAELENLEKRYAEGELLKYTDEIAARALDPNAKLLPDKQRKPGTCGQKFFSTDYLRMYHLRQRVSKQRKQGNGISQLLDEYKAIANIKQEILTMNPEDATAAQEALDLRIRDWTEEFEEKSSGDQALFWIYIDNRKSLQQDPPLLLWDRRFAEPIKVLEDDFVPPREMCLLDIRPKSLWPVLRQNNLTDWENFDYIIGHLFMFSTQSVKKGLTSLAHGAYDWIVPECPSLTDPEKGGSHNLDELSVRCLSQEMLKEIIESWMKWPFRPSRYQLMVKTGRAVREEEDDPFWKAAAVGKF